MVDGEVPRGPAPLETAATRALAAAGAEAATSASAPTIPSVDLCSRTHSGSVRTLSAATKPAQLGLVYERRAGVSAVGQGASRESAGRWTDGPSGTPDGCAGGVFTPAEVRFQPASTPTLALVWSWANLHEFVTEAP
jgi:hypothetical protein